MIVDPARPTSEPTVVASDFKPRETRYTTILLVARLLHDGREDLCRIRNVSAGGMLIEGCVALAVGTRIEVELRNLQTAEAIVAWTRDDRAGCQFVAPVEVQSFLASPPKSDSSAPVPRSPRVATACPVELRRAGKTLHAVLTDLSQSGGRLRLTDELRVDERIYVNIPGMEPRRAVVRWAGDDACGVGFVDTIAFPELCSWLHDDATRFAVREEFASGG